uniref:Uncharacterized protein n=1 Tax=Lactuca sativa TaxID=4236 RepID=A0A9R1WY40_LACSA|nr:hypothetical protein LSAT_V11C800394710 [Lactuca sativa]
MGYNFKLYSLSFNPYIIYVRLTSCTSFSLVFFFFEIGMEHPNNNQDQVLVSFFLQQQSNNDFKVQMDPPPKNSSRIEEFNRKRRCWICFQLKQVLSVDEQVIPINYEEQQEEFDFS